MRKIATVIFLLIASKYWCYSQVDSLALKDSLKTSETNLVFDKTYYLQKSKERNIEGWVFLCIGAGLISYGLLQDKLNPCNGCLVNIPAGISYEIGGILPLLISIPFFISSYNNKQKALVFP